MWCNHIHKLLQIFIWIFRYRTHATLENRKFLHLWTFHCFCSTNHASNPPPSIMAYLCTRWHSMSMYLVIIKTKQNCANINIRMYVNNWFKKCFPGLKFVMFHYLDSIVLRGISQERSYYININSVPEYHWYYKRYNIICYTLILVHGRAPPKGGRASTMKIFDRWDVWVISWILLLH